MRHSLVGVLPGLEGRLGGKDTRAFAEFLYGMIPIDTNELLLHQVPRCSDPLRLGAMLS